MRRLGIGLFLIIIDKNGENVLPETNAPFYDPTKSIELFRTSLTSVHLSFFAERRVGPRSSSLALRPTNIRMVSYAHRFDDIECTSS